MRDLFIMEYNKKYEFFCEEVKASCALFVCSSICLPVHLCALISVTICNRETPSVIYYLPSRSAHCTYTEKAAL